MGIWKGGTNITKIIFSHLRFLSKSGLCRNSKEKKCPFLAILQGTKKNNVRNENYCWLA